MKGELKIKNKDDLLGLLYKNSQYLLHHYLEENLVVNKIENNVIELTDPKKVVRGDLYEELAKVLHKLTGKKWIIILNE